ETGIGLPSDVGQPVQAPCSEIASAPRLEEDQAVGQRHRVRDGVWVRGTVNLGSAARRTASYSPSSSLFWIAPQQKTVGISPGGTGREACQGSFQHLRISLLAPLARVLPMPSTISPASGKDRYCNSRLFSIAN